MKPRDIFRIVVATAGLYLFTIGIVGLIDTILSTITASDAHRIGTGYYGTGYYAGVGVVKIMLGVLIMKGHPPITDWAFPPEEPPKDNIVETKPDV